MSHLGCYLRAIFSRSLRNSLKTVSRYWVGDSLSSFKKSREIWLRVETVFIQRVFDFEFYSEKRMFIMLWV